jgi:hypothetical protein
MINISSSEDITRLRQLFVTCSELNFNNVTNIGWWYSIWRWEILPETRQENIDMK